MNPFRVYELDECGGDGYPLAWHDLGNGKGVKHLVREQAGHRCVRCLHPFVCGSTPGEWSPCDERCEHGLPVRFRHRGDWHEASELNGTIAQNIAIGYQFEAKARVLTVHHLHHGHDAKRDLRWWNLVALCQRDHLSIQGSVVLERVYPWPHDEWFKPYAAGWYAHSYLGEDLSREETLGRLDELLGLELAVASPDRSADA